MLNYVLIKHFGELGAAVAFVLSYIIMTIIGWSINHFLVKLHATPIKKMLVPLIMVVPFYLCLYFLMDVESLYYAMGIKLVLCALLVVSFFWTDKVEIISFIKGILNKKK